MYTVASYCMSNVVQYNIHDMYYIHVYAIYVKYRHVICKCKKNSLSCCYFNCYCYCYDKKIDF